MKGGFDNNAHELADMEKEKMIEYPQIIASDTRGNIIPVLKIGDTFTEEEFNNLCLEDTGSSFANLRIYKNETHRFLIHRLETSKGIRKNIWHMYARKD
jgi:hypothetical protein